MQSVGSKETKARWRFEMRGA